MSNWINCGYVIEYLENSNYYKVEYDWGVSVLTKYFKLYEEALAFVSRYKKRMRLANRENYPK